MCFSVFYKVGDVSLQNLKGLQGRSNEDIFIATEI